MKNSINIQYNNQIFPYILEYSKKSTNGDGHNATDGHDIGWCKSNEIIRVIGEDINYYRDKNDWYSIKNISLSNDNIPNSVYTSNVKVYIPTHSISTYVKSIKYVVTFNIWINGVKVDLGSFMFKPTDTYAIPTGPIKRGNNEYYECIDFDIIDPFYLTYSDDWIDFRHNICGEPLELNNTGASLQVSLFVVDEYEDRYMLKDGVIGGCTSFNITNNTDYLSLNIQTLLNPLGISYNLSMNDDFKDLLTYLKETYCIEVTHDNIKYDLVIKNKNSIIPGITVAYCAKETFGKTKQIIKWSDIINDTNEINGIKAFFNKWNNFEDGWCFAGSLYVTVDDFEPFSIVSNELPITQEVFSIFTKNGSEKIIDIDDMNFNTYNVVNKIENRIVTLERPNESKSNIIQPVFFRVKDTETLTLHPAVTENISINLDDYKSKVERFTLMIADCKFNQIGANNYGVIFKITGNTIPASVNAGTYYILDENLELVTTGKFNCIR